jgi:hypothetical protein
LVVGCQNDAPLRHQPPTTNHQPPVLESETENERRTDQRVAEPNYKRPELSLT